MNKALKWIFFSLVLIIVGLSLVNLFSSRKKNQENLPKLGENEFIVPDEILKKYKFQTVKLGEIPEYERIVLPGIVSYDLSRTAKVGSRVSGRIESIFVNLGDYVKKGQTLVEIASIELGEMEAKYKKAITRRDSLVAHLDRVKDLYEKKIVSAKEYESVVMEYKTAKTEVENAYNALLSYGLSPSDISQILNGKTYSLNLKIRAPISGTITERNAVLGQAVTPDDTLFTISDLSKLWVILEVFEKDLNQVKVGQYADITPIGSDVKYRAKVAHVGEVIDANTRSAEIRLELENTEKKFRPGQSVSSNILGTSPNLTSTSKTLPMSAVHKIEGKNYVFVKLSPNHFKAVNVEIGKTIDDKVEILSGIGEDDLIVTEGSFILKSQYLKI